MPNIGDKVTVKFSFEVDGIARAIFNTEVIMLKGWIVLDGKKLEIATVPENFVVRE